jgi:hypothetical protein
LRYVDEVIRGQEGWIHKCADDYKEDDYRKQGEFPDPVGHNVPAVAPQRPSDRLPRTVDRTFYS